MGKPAIINPIFHLMGSRCSRAGAPPTWSNGATSRPRAELQPEPARRGGTSKKGKKHQNQEFYPCCDDKTAQKMQKGKEEREEKRRKRRMKGVFLLPLRLAGVFSKCGNKKIKFKRKKKRGEVGSLLKRAIVSNSETEQLVILLPGRRGGARPGL